MEANGAGIPVELLVLRSKDLIAAGFLVHPGDSERLGNSILQLLDDPELMTRIGMAARTHVLQPHSTAGMCQKYYDLMQALLKKR